MSKIKTPPDAIIKPHELTMHGDIRIDNYYWPYHHKIHELIDSFKNQFNELLFWDAHSIRRKVSTIRKEPFPDFPTFLNPGKTANKRDAK